MLANQERRERLVHNRLFSIGVAALTRDIIESPRITLAHTAETFKVVIVLTDQQAARVVLFPRRVSEGDRFYTVSKSNPLTPPDTLNIALAACRRWLSGEDPLTHPGFVIDPHDRQDLERWKEGLPQRYRPDEETALIARIDATGKKMGARVAILDANETRHEEFQSFRR